MHNRKPHARWQNKSVFMLFLGVLLLFHSCFAQNDTTAQVSSVPLYRQVLVPSSFLLTGALLSGSNWEQRFQTKGINSTGNDFYTPIDNYLQYVPAATLYIADLAGVQAKNHWFDQTKYLFISQVITSGIVFGLKRLTDKRRPDGGKHSFPSGHTATAFASASVLYLEFKNTAPAVALSGFAIAATTGGLRIANNKHWVSDVLFSTGLGMLVTNVVYFCEPIKRFNPFKKSENITLIPNISYQATGIYLSYRF